MKKKKSDKDKSPLELNHDMQRANNRFIIVIVVVGILGIVYCAYKILYPL